jgi:hypothetical protein
LVSFFFLGYISYNDKYFGSSLDFLYLITKLTYTPITKNSSPSKG